MIKHILAAAILTVCAGGASAAPRRTDITVAAPVQDTGSEALPVGNDAGAVTFGGTLPGNGGEGIVQSAASLPLGFTTGTEADISARIYAAYMRARAPLVALALR